EVGLRALEHAVGLQRIERHFGPRVAGSGQGPDVDHVGRHVPGAVAEPALRRAAIERRLAALEQGLEHLRPGAGVLALAAAGGGLAVAGADAPADPLLPLARLDALVYGAQVHQIVTPRSR